MGRETREDRLQRLREKKKAMLKLKASYKNNTQDVESNKNSNKKINLLTQRVINKKKRIQEKKHLKPKRPAKVRVNSHNAIRSRVRPQYKSKVYKPLSEWKDILKGEQPVFILGNGPSLSYQNLSLLENYCTIGINRILASGFKPTIIFWQDNSVTKDQKDIYLNSDAIKVGRRGCCAVERDDFLYFTLSSSKHNGQEFPSKCVPDILYGHGNTINIASQFAISLKPSCIVMLGVDCKYEGGKTNNYGINKRHSKNTMRNCCKALEKVKKGCKIPIYNCGWNEFWKQNKLEDVLNDLTLNAFDKSILKIN